MSRWTMYLEDRDWHGSRQLMIVRGDRSTGRTVRSIVTSFDLSPIEEGEALAPASATLMESREARQDRDGDVTNFLQAALDCAWAAGFRPGGWEDNRAELNGELTATKQHLADMRKMAKVPGA